MTTPQRHDIFEDDTGTRVAVRQVFPPNALGIAYVEYKNLDDSNLQFLPQAEFTERFKWVENFSTTDTFAQKMAHQISDAPSTESAGASAESSESDATPIASDEGQGSASEEVRSAKPSRSE